MSTHYILENGVPRPAELMEWANWFQNHHHDRVIERTEWEGVRVSTVFLGLDHNWGGGPPILFETMVFGGPMNEECRRYATMGEAKTGHFDMVDTVKAAMANPQPCRDCGRTEGVTLAADPFASEIHDDETPVWLCADCRHERAMEI